MKCSTAFVDAHNEDVAFGGDFGVRVENAVLGRDLVCSSDVDLLQQQKAPCVYTPTRTCRK